MNEETPADPPVAPSEPRTSSRVERSEHVDPVSSGDALATAILDELLPLRFGEVEDRKQRDACFRIRQRAVLEMRMRDADLVTDDLEHDEYDDSAVQIVGRDDAKIIATCRLVLPAAGRVLPTVKAFELELDGADEIVELGRVVVDPLYRGDGHSVFMGLVAQAWRSMRLRGFAGVIGATSGRMLALFDALGFAITRLGPPRNYWGEERHPFRCDATPTIPRVAREWLASEEAPPASRKREAPQ
jgi:N-acyl-L-homoserine lactone synthetase